MDDRPGGLASMLSLVAEQRGNIVTIQHNRLGPHLALGVTGVEMLIEVRDRPHQDRIVATLRARGHQTEGRDERA